MDTAVDPFTRDNAILLQGTPISSLPTARIFAYATHFEANPLGLEWVDDQTCVLVFSSSTSAKDAFSKISKVTTVAPEAPVSEEEMRLAKAFPVTLWPPEERINQSLGKELGLKGEIRMRWARQDDVKKKGAKQQSKFYKKHGDNAGKESLGAPPANKRRREEGDDSALARRLDMELDDIRNPLPPPSKMRSDYIAADGRTLLERFDADQPDLASRIADSRPPSRTGRRRGERGHRDRDHDGDSSRTVRRPKKTQQELDDELDAFLNDRPS